MSVPVPEPDALSAAIGARVREARIRRSLTLDQLAETASLSRRMLVNVEQGSANPSVTTLLRLAQALGLGLPELVEPPRTGDVTVTLSGTAPVLWRGVAGGTAALVASAKTPDVLELWTWTMHPGESRESDAHPAGARELVHVVSGALALVVDGDTQVLGVGDAASFPGDRPHAYRAAGDEPVTFTLTVFEPAP
ncbi:MAG TPA: XRE family transcriptional regulator [Microcella sp.]|nr:XRE family transcriptional regulator [Microcella sp.]